MTTSRRFQFGLHGLLYGVAVAALYLATTRQFVVNGPAALLPAIAGSFAGSLLAKRIGFKSLAGVTFGGGFGGAIGVGIPLIDVMLNEPIPGLPSYGGYGPLLDALTFLVVVGVGFVIGLGCGVVFAIIFSAIRWHNPSADEGAADRD